MGKIQINVGEAPSPAWTMNSTDWKKVFKGGLLAFGAAFIFVVLNWLAAGNWNWQLFLTVCVPAAISTGANAVIKWWQGQ